MRALFAGLVSACLAATASAETALDFPAAGPRAAWNNLVLRLTQADGSIDVNGGVKVDHRAAQK